MAEDDTKDTKETAMDVEDQVSLCNWWIVVFLLIQYAFLPVCFFGEYIVFHFVHWLFLLQFSRANL